jgi:hypothetical protein
LRHRYAQIAAKASHAVTANRTFVGAAAVSEKELS